MKLMDIVNEDLQKAISAKEESVKLLALNTLKKFLQGSGDRPDAGINRTLESERNDIEALIRSSQTIAEIYMVQHRNDLAKMEMQKISIYEHYLPPKLNKKELETAVEAIVEKTGAQKRSYKDLHKVMKVAMEELKGKAYDKNITSMVQQVMIYH